MLVITTSHSNNRIILLDRNYRVVGSCNYLEFNHLDKSKFAYIRVQNYIFRNDVIVRVFAEMNLQNGKKRDVFFEINNVRFKI